MNQQLTIAGAFDNISSVLHGGTPHGGVARWELPAGRGNRTGKEKFIGTYDYFKASHRSGSTDEASPAR